MSYYFFLIFLVAALLQIPTVNAASEEHVRAGNIIRVSLRDLHPTQVVVGFDEIYARLSRLSGNPRKVLKAFCELNGQGGVESFTDRSTIFDVNSFSCRAPIGTYPDDMVSVVVAPNDDLYLVNGHHKCLLFWHLRQGGPNLKISVRVVCDYRSIKSMDEFWETMQRDQNVWLFDAVDRSIPPSQLPQSLGLQYFQDDPYRSLLYFTDHIAWEKPEARTDPKTGLPDAAVPFVEFYWAREVRSHVYFEKKSLLSVDGYMQAIRSVCETIFNSKTDNVGGSGKTAAQLGRTKRLRANKLRRAIKARKDEINAMLAYKSKFH